MTTSQLLHTERLDLVAATLKHIEAELLDRTAFSELLGAEVPREWPPGEYDRNAQEYFRKRLEAGGPSLVGWLVWYAVTRTVPRTLVAGAGFSGPPAAGAVEIGYSVISAARGTGYATEIVKALLVYAFAHPAVKEIVAQTTEGNAASIRVLSVCGFTRIGPGSEPGLVKYRITREEFA